MGTCRYWRAVSDGSRGLNALYEDKLDAVTLVLLLHYLYRIMFTHHVSYSPANTSVTVGSHTEGSREQGTSLQELEATAASVKQPCSGCRTGMPSLCSCPSSSAPVRVGSHQNHPGFSCSCSPSL